MARVKDFTQVVRTIGPVSLFQHIRRRVIDDNLTMHAAAVAYAWLFAIFPFLIFVITLFAYIPEKQKVNARDKISEAVHKVMAEDAADTIVANLNQVTTKSHTGLLSIGLIVTLWVASGGMAMTMQSLDTAYDVKKPRKFYVQRPIAMLLTIIFTALLLAVLLLLPVGTSIEHFVTSSRLVPAGLLTIITLVRYTVGILLMFLTLSVLYTYGPRKKHPLSFFSPGAIFTVTVWIVLASTFRIYVERFGQFQKTYGAVGGVTIILLFFYLDALVMLVGAEINSQLDHLSTGPTLFETAPPPAT